MESIMRIIRRGDDLHAVCAQIDRNDIVNRPAHTPPLPFTLPSRTHLLQRISKVYLLFQSRRRGFVQS